MSAHTNMDVVATQATHAQTANEIMLPLTQSGTLGINLVSDFHFERTLTNIDTISFIIRDIIHPATQLQIYQRRERSKGGTF